MKKIIQLSILILAFTIVNPCFAQPWESSDAIGAASTVDLVPLDRGFLTTRVSVTSSVSSIPTGGILEGRKSLTLTNEDDAYSVYIVNTSSMTWDQGWNLLANSSISMDLGDNTTNSTVFVLTSDSTITVPVTTLEIR